MEYNAVVFSESGKQNTDRVLSIVNDYVKKEYISKIVISSTTGYTVSLAEKIINTDYDYIVCKQDISDEYCMKADVYKELTTKYCVVDIPVKYIQKKKGSEVAQYLRKISQGIKVCFELTEYLIENNKLLSGEKVILVAGTLKGADTAIVVKINAYKQYSVERILCIPSQG